MKLVKKEARRARNKAAKIAKATARAEAAANPFQEVYRPERERNIPRLAWLGSKQFAQHGPQSKSRPGNAILHAEAVVEDASRSFAIEVNKILNPPQEVAEETPVPVVPMDSAPEVAAL